ncbi:hypothetical protein H2204_003038 [Knufia peltigerae]|uniref:Major facilitator superfamily (MFS) profile domain-containing protein n=1 Tax=Knufia peltigerae TaxID=1002370 RepID=A0AA38YBJ2_9EURO|nr:hypothetical protein H2204_003038 [Knufia peltigerae]
MASEPKTPAPPIELAEAELAKSSFEHHESNVEEDEADAAMMRRITWKIDLRLLPLCVFIYCLCFLDRVNIGNAKLWHLERDLNMHGLQFNIVTLVFYIPYILFEIPANMIISRIKPRYWISGLTFGFGLTVTLCGLCTNFGGFLTARLFIGVFESGMFPGFLLLIGSWYTRRQVGARLAWFLVANDIAGSVSGLLGAGLGSLDGTNGYSGWSWIFFIEGAMTCFAAIIAFFFLLPFPKESTFLTPEEKEFWLRKLAIENAHYEEDKMKLNGVWKALLDWKLIATAFMYLAVCTSAYSITVFQPSILSTFGWSSMKANLLTSPVRIASGIVSVSVATLSNRLNKRGIFVAIGFCVAILGLLFTMLHHDYRVRYMGLYFGAIGIYIAQPLVIAWGVAQVAGRTKRGTLTAAASSLGQVGGIISALIFPNSDKPYYVPGGSVCVGFAAAGCVVCLTMWFFLSMENKMRKAGKRDHLRSLPQEEQYKLGEKHPDFRYTM